MREYRGKRVDGEGWVYGSLMIFENEFSILPKQKCHDVIVPDLHFHEVNPESVGQWTGLKDKNGKKIFEGDICKSISHNISRVILFRNSQYCFGEWHIEEIPGLLKVKGNKFDNPELLEGEDQ